jgi:EmrB/QacA subfamily drug resistance transporter
VPDERRPARTGLILLIACAAQFMVILDVSIVNVALPSIRTALHFSENNLQWVVSAYTVTFAGFLMLGGRAGDLLGRKRMFIIGVSVFSLASLLGALATTSGLLVAARGLQGLGGAIVAPATLSIITTTFPEGPERNRALGIWGAVAAAGGSAGALFGGILTEALSWRWILLVNVPIGAVLIPVAWRYIVESTGSLAHRHFDVAGAVTLTAGQIALVLGIVNVDRYGFTSPQVLIGIGVGIALLLLFVTIEHRWAKAPLVPLSILRSRTLTGANVVVGLMGAAMFALWFFLSLYLQQVLGLTPVQAGLAFLPMTGTLAVTATLAPRLIARLGGRTTLATGMSLIGLGALWLTQISATGSWATDVLGPSVVTALGMGMSFVPVTIAAVAGVPPERAGLASGLVNTSRQMGGALGLAVLTSVAASLTSDYVRANGVGALDGAALVHGYSGAFLLGSLLAFTGAVAALLLLPRLKPQAAPAVGDPAVADAAP